LCLTSLLSATMPARQAIDELHGGVMLDLQ
jgi:hypothetical protein